MDYLELVVRYSEQREKIYEEFIQKLKEWKIIRSRTIQGLLDLIDYIDSFHKGANVANIVGSGAGVLGAGAVLLTPFTGGLSLIIGFGGLVASAVGATTNLVASFTDNCVARKNCKKAQDLIDKDGKATEELISSMTKYHELTQKLSECLKGAHGKINFESLPPIDAQRLVVLHYMVGLEVIASAAAPALGKGASKAELIASASAFGKGASKAGARLMPVISTLCIVIDVWSIVTTAVDMKDGSKSAASKELYKVVEQFRKQIKELGECTAEVTRIQSQIKKKQEEAETAKRMKTKQKTKICEVEKLVPLFRKKAHLESEEDSDSDDEEKSITFCLMNARSVFNKWDEISRYVDEKGIDVLAVTETWDRKEPWVTAVPGYQQFFYSPREDRRGGGVGALVKTGIEVKDLKIDNITAFECLKCTLTVLFKKGSQVTIHAYILYRPPDSLFDTFLKEFKDLSNKSLEDSKVIIMGDFNIHWENFVLTKSVNMRHMLRDLNFHQHVNEETHEDNGTLDWVVTRQTERYLIKSLKVDKKIKMFINLDHYPVIFTVTLRPELLDCP